VALALAAGMIAQSAARHLRLPGIVLLLGMGVVLGPDLLNLVDPAGLGHALQILVGFAVAVILFEGGMNLNLSRLRRQARVIRRLLTLGAAVTAVGGTLAAALVLRWDWSTSVLFGTLVIVTGPTVVTPLLKRIKVQHKVATVLEAEGVLIDPIGAIAAVIALEIVVGLAGVESHMPWEALLWLVPRLSFGAIFGLAGGLLIAVLLRFKDIVPRGMENMFTLSLVLAIFHLSDRVLAESGIVTVTVAGMVLGNVRTRVQKDLLEFKEQLTVLLIGLLFVLLAAGVRMESVKALGWRGVITVSLLMLVIRPLNIWLCTRNSDFNWREKLFMSWLAPRGIVAAAVAALFAGALAANGIAGGAELQAMVFLVIGITVLLQGLTGGFVAQLLGIRRVTNRGYTILGANELGHQLGRLLRDSGEEVTFLDSNPVACHVVEQDGFRVIFGNVLEERTLQRAQLDDKAACIALTPNEEANLLFTRRAIDEFKVPRVYLALSRVGGDLNASVIDRHGGTVLFGHPRDLELWALRLRRGTAGIEIWRRAAEDSESEGEGDALKTPKNLCLPLITWRVDKVFPANDAAGVKHDDVVHFAIFSERRDEAREWLVANGWQAAYPEADPQKLPEMEAVADR